MAENNEEGQPTSQDRAWNRAFATTVIMAVRESRAQPQALWPEDGAAMNDETLIFKLSQEIMLLERERDEACARIRAFTDAAGQK